MTVGKRGIRNCFMCFAILTAAAATAYACGWFGTSHSVRFNAYYSVRDFGRLPPLPRNIDDQPDEDGIGSTWDKYFKEQERRDKEINELWTKAAEAAGENNLQQTRKLLLDYLDRTKIVNESDEIEDRQTRRNSAIDQLDALNALDKGSAASNVKIYLDARAAFDIDKPEDEVRQMLNPIKRDPNLRDNVKYLASALAYRDADYETAEKGFKNLAAQYSQSEKREAALYLAPLSAMKQSQTLDPSKYSEDLDKTLRRSHKGFLRLMQEYPKGNYTNEARGRLGQLSLLKNDVAGALAEYYRLLSEQKDLAARLEGAISLKLTRSKASEDDMKRVEAALVDEPEAALAYAYYEIYNFSVPKFNISLGEEFSDDFGDREALSRVAAYASKLMKRYPNASVHGSFVLRAAMTKLELGEDGEASHLARRAVKMGLKGEELWRALWVQGTADYRMERLAPARAAFSALIAENPSAEIMEGARRTLAMISEDMGDLDEALEQYIALDYEEDSAYFIDVLMTTDQLAKFVEAHKQHPRYNELFYSLGIRRLREGRWREARDIFSRVRAIGWSTDYEFRNESLKYEMEQSDDGELHYNPKDPYYFDLSFHGVRREWLDRDLKTANDLERLEREAESAEGDEAKAEALYQVASYLYDGGTLLFYNPAIWMGSRTWNLSDLDEESRYRVPYEAELLWKYSQEHEPIARAAEIYLEIVKKYPKTRAAKDALYTAAVCNERLSNYNPYWRKAYETGRYAGGRNVTYEDVATTYPNYQMPRGTYGWKPSTRTVNGGPGWDAPPPRPKPQPAWKRYGNRFAQIWRFAFQRAFMIAIFGIALFSFFIAFFRPRRKKYRVRHKE